MTGIILERGDQTLITYDPVIVREDTRALEADHVRGPYSDRWYAAGDIWTPPTLRLTYEAASDAEGIAYATNAEAARFIADIEQAAILTTILGVYEIKDILDVQLAPIVSGHAVTIRISARREAAISDATLLRFINNDPWELR